MHRVLAAGTVLLLAVALLGCGSRQPVLDAQVEVKGRDVTVRVQGENLNLGKKHHAHIVMNDGPEIMMYSPDYVYRSVEPGEHTIKVYLSDRNHNNIPGLEQTFTVRVE